MSQRKLESMAVINPYAAAVDVGSKSHFVSVGQDETKDVREFGVYSKDHRKMIDYLIKHRIKTIAMESTGSYWRSLFSALQNAGFEVLLVSGHQTKNVRAKTDVKDCVWMQKLHTLGLLRSCFLPDEQTERLRTIQRHRNSLIEQSAKMSNKMQKALRLMNVRLDVVLNDITGKSGMAIIEHILSGERNGQVLSQLADPRCKTPKEEIALALEGHWNTELLFELQDCFELYTVYQEKIRNCEQKIANLLMEFTKDVAEPVEELTKKQTKGKNQPKFDLATLSYKLYGVDLFAIQSISASTILTLVCEIGQGIYEFPTAKHFASFLRLAPNNRISGGKVISSRTPKGSNRLALALRNAANTIDRGKDGQLKSFFKRISYKKGRGAAITATARKMAIIIWNMITKKQSYQPINNETYQLMIRNRVIATIKHKMEKMQIPASELMAAPA